MRLRDRHYLKAKMAEKHYSLSDLALLARVSKATIGHLTSGHRDTCTPKVAVQIEKALGVEPGSLFEARSIQQRRSA